MKATMPIVALVVTMSAIIPYIWFVLAGRKNNKKKNNQIENIIKKENLLLTQKEKWHDNFIGIDDNKKVLLFIKSSDDGDVFNIINLMEVSNCKINKTTYNIKGDKKTESVLQALNLELSFLDKRPLLILNFYDVDSFFAENFERERAEKWLALISLYCNKNSLKKAS